MQLCISAQKCCIILAQRKKSANKFIFRAKSIQVNYLQKIEIIYYLSQWHCKKSELTNQYSRVYELVNLIALMTKCGGNL